MAVQTVLGTVNGGVLGRTLTHEHFQVDYRSFLLPAPSGLEQFLDGDITLETVGFVQRYPYSSLSNVSFLEDVKNAVLYDVEVFKRFGGGAIVENTVHGLKRDVQFMKDVSRATGVHIIAGAGFYLASTQSKSVLEQSVATLYDSMKEELVRGCLECRDVKCGFLGEIASNYPIHDFERKVIVAVGNLQEHLGCPVSFHPGRDPKAPWEILRLYTEAGGDSRKAVMSHLDRTFKDWNQFLDLAAEYKCYLQQDLFGTEVLSYQFDEHFQMPSDAQRIGVVKMLIENGLSNRILMSQDVHTRHRLIKFGGHGYCHLFKNVIPKMLAKKISQELIDKITIENSRNWLSWNCS